MQRIAIANKAAGLLADADLAKWVAAIQRQLAGDFAPAWNQSAVLHLLAPGEQPDKLDWIINMVAASSQEGALGSHWLAGQTPTGEIGVQTALDDGVTPSSVLSHEILEMVLDPDAAEAVQVGSLFLAREACDRVEASDPNYLIDGVQVENFSLPSAFTGGPGPWDFRKVCSSNVVLPNGYQLQVDIGNGQWSQITGALARRSKQIAAPSSRRAIRMARAGADPSKLILVAA